MGNCQRQRGGENIRKGRVAMICFAGLGHLILVIAGSWAILDTTTFPLEGFWETSVSLLGLLALGSAAAFFTACLNAMERVPYSKYRPWWRRILKCVDVASQVETLFRISIGISVGLGAYLVNRLPGG